MKREGSIDAGVDVLLEKRALFRAFLRQQLGTEAEVDDLLQHALVKAMRRTDSVRESEKIVSWFYRILRRTLIDHHRSELARLRRDDAWGRERTPDEASSATLCACLSGLLPKLEPRSAELVRRVDLGSEPVAQVAASLKLTSNAATVALHRARARLRRELIAFCGDCTQGACLECDCREKSL